MNSASEKPVPANPAPAPPFGLLPLAPGDPRYLGPYRLVGRLGTGGMGVVYAALDGRDRRAAVKCVHRVLASDADFRARFAREVNLVRRVRASCVPAFLGADTRAEVPWLATEYVPGPTLEAHVRARGPLTGDALTAFALGTAEALTAIHAQGVVHRDLKPGNVILSPAGPRVLDFGIARATDGTALTRTGGVVGTPGWISPEQYRGQDVTDRSDVFAWAGLVAYAATGQGPFGRGTADLLVSRILSEPPSLAGVPARLRGVLERALDKDPGRRPNAVELWSTTAALLGSRARDDVARVMARAWGGAGVPAAPADDWTRGAPPRRSWIRRHRLPLAVGAALLAVVLVAGVGIRSLAGPQVLEEGAPGPQNAGDGATGGALGAGAPEDAPEELRELYGTGEVVVEPASDTEPVLLRSLRPASGEGPGLDQLRLTFEGVSPGEFNDVALRIRAEYLPDHGALQIHSDEMAGLTQILPGDTALDFQAPTNTGILAQLSPQNPEAELRVVVVADFRALLYVPAQVRARAQGRLDYPGGVCLVGESRQDTVPTFPGTDDFGPYDASLTGGAPTGSCAYENVP